MGHNSNTVIAVANDGDLQQRISAIAALEGIPSPDSWVAERRWELAAKDTTEGGLLDAYQYAIDTDPNHFRRLGRDPGVVSDAKLLAVVQAVRGE